jgi:peroxiredoxin
MTDTKQHNRKRTILLLITLFVVIGGGTAGVLLATLDRGEATVELEPSTPAAQVADETATPVPATEEPQVEKPEATVPTGYHVGEQAPDFALASLAGETVSLSAFRGRVIILDFWASWCVPCRISMPDLYALWKEHEADGVVFLGVSLDRSEADARSYIQSKSYDGFVPLFGSYTAASNVARRYGVTGIPRTFLIDRDGIIRFADHPSALTPAEVAALL